MVALADGRPEVRPKGLLSVTALAAILKWSIEYWYVIAVAALVFGLAAWGQKMRGERDEIRAEYAEYRKTIAEAAVKAAEDALKRTIADTLHKEKIDAAHAKAVARLNADVGRMRRERDDARSSFLSAATSCPASPEGADRYRAEYQRAYRDFVSGLRAEGDRGSKAVVDLNAAKEWAKNNANPTSP